MKAVVCGMVATYPVGGVLWDYGQYALGLERLGCEVLYLEDTGLPGYDPVSGDYSEDSAYGAAFLERELPRLSSSLAGRWHLRAADGTRYGLDTADLVDTVAEADLFLNVSGGCLLRDEYMSCRRKVLIDTDPGWNHFVIFPNWDENPGWQASHGPRAHDFFFTYAELIGQERCLLPDLGLRWLPTRPPVVLDCWAPEPPGEAWTTVLSWDNYHRPVRADGRLFGSKVSEFERVAEMPSRLPDLKLELALGGVEPPLDRCRQRGWQVRRSSDVSATAAAYRSYVQGSRGEFSVAKNVYVGTTSGWFSCRSSCYLASSRPVVLQDTGFSGEFPAEEGILSFTTPEEAEKALRAVEDDYERHSRAARLAAEEHFGAERVLGQLLEGVLGG